MAKVVKMTEAIFLQVVFSYTPKSFLVGRIWLRLPKSSENGKYRL